MRRNWRPGPEGHQNENSRRRREKKKRKSKKRAKGTSHHREVQVSRENVLSTPQHVGEDRPSHGLTLKGSDKRDSITFQG